MNINEITQKGGFVTPDLIEFNEVWTHTDKEAGDPANNFIIEDKIKFFVKQASWLEFRTSVEGKQFRENEKEPLNNEALAVATCLRLDNDERLTYDQVINLQPTLFYIFRNAVFEVYSPKKN